ncbi:hypothetical protein AB0D60_29320 [Streptomyces sp. NPDC048306]|uniref:hypothetical protein n=1 Tax=unclassified Streptomyces TaxID=2593676 RepID=UPI0033DCB8DE
MDGHRPISHYSQVNQSAPRTRGDGQPGSPDTSEAAGLRAGYEELFKGKDSKAIAAITGHKDGSKVLDGYMRIVDRWGEQDNALVGLL